jgi:Ca2+-binding EF-hand superfamily protein
MDKLREVAKDPAKLEEALKKAWSQIDTKNQGWISFDDFNKAAEATIEYLKIDLKPPTPEQVEQMKKLCDPEGTGKMSFEAFCKLQHSAIEKAKNEGRL